MEGWMKGGEKEAGNGRRDRGEANVRSHVDGNGLSPVWSGE